MAVVINVSGHGPVKIYNDRPGTRPPGIAATDYDGYIGLEYRPTIDAAETILGTRKIAGV